LSSLTSNTAPFIKGDVYGAKKKKKLKEVYLQQWMVQSLRIYQVVLVNNLEQKQGERSNGY